VRSFQQSDVKGSYSLWRDTAQGAVGGDYCARSISRILYRDQAEIIAADPMALARRKRLLIKAFDKALSSSERSFLYMPVYDK